MDAPSSSFEVFNIPKEILAEIIAHCKKERPFEACGLLSGIEGTAFSTWKMKNVHRSRYSFSMDLAEIDKVFAEMEKKQQRFIGIYHSHPTDIAYPSREDILYNNYPDAVHIIVSLARKKPDVRAFKFKGTKAIPLYLNVTGATRL